MKKATMIDVYILVLRNEMAESMECKLATKLRRSVPRKSSIYTPPLPTWLRNLWRGANFSETTINKTIQAIEGESIWVAGDGSVRDQLGSHAWCLANKNSHEPFFQTCGPVDGDRHNMKALRAEASHVLAGIAFICSLEKYVTKRDATIHVITDCQTVIKRLNEKHINSPTMVLADHMDVIYQIRMLIQQSQFTFKITYAQTIKNDEFDLGSPEEKLAQRMHLLAYNYFKKKDAITPRRFPDYLPGSGITIVANHKLIVTNIGMTLQTIERRIIRDKYIMKRMGIPTTLIPSIDKYTLGRVLMKTPAQHNIYSKIINKELNTMTVNARWKNSTNTCPVSLNHTEDLFHPLVCQSQDLVRVCEQAITDFKMKLKFFKTYSPLAAYTTEFLETLYLGITPLKPLIANTRYIVELERAYETQTALGWDNFVQGIVSKHWRYL